MNFRLFYIFLGLNFLLETTVITCKKFNPPKPSKIPSEPETKQTGCVYNDKKGNVMIRVMAKPGAKTNQITGLTEEGVGVQINAPPVDGEANSELVKFMSGILDVRKSAVSLDKGAKSRQKTLQVTSGVISVDEVMEKLKKSSDK
ncbi:UPF0235 protein C15orf40 homolog isoform X2 [Planococcus citri]|uniref:UPF0235 protein C15orf40 homolog isoform X2 n=1 Tax=Planococcus citri TaxID=170843 RepID=UPI0031F88D33